MTLSDLTQRLTQLLDIGSFASCDVSLNGLQIGDLSREVHRIAFAVDASKASIEKAIELGADVLFVHHGMYWGRPIAITDRFYDKIRTLMDNNLAVFACHLPLDCHLELGNNGQMAKRLDLEDVQPFSTYHGVVVGYKGVLPEPLTADQIVDRLGIRRNPTNYQINTKDRTFRKVGIVSGDGAEDMYQALEHGLELLITGESQYSVTNDCLEAGLGMLCLGHYETETFGVKAVMEYVSSHFGLETCFVDIPLGL